MEMISQTVEDSKNIDQKPGEKYENLIDWYYDGIHNFSYMISRSLPDQFKKNNTELTEKNSCHQGIIAFKRLIKILKQQQNGVKPDKVDKNVTKYHRLHMWYKDSLIEFMTMTFKMIPKKFQKNSEKATEIYCCKSAIEAFERCIVSLKEQLREIS